MTGAAVPGRAGHGQSRDEGPDGEARRSHEPCSPPADDGTRCHTKGTGSGAGGSLIIVANEPVVLSPPAAAVLARIIRAHFLMQRSGEQVSDDQGLAIDRPSEAHSSP